MLSILRVPGRLCCAATILLGTVHQDGALCSVRADDSGSSTLEDHSRTDENAAADAAENSDAGTDAVEPPPVPLWHLEPGQTFAVLVTTQRASTVSVDGTDRQMDDVSRVKLQYTILTPAGDGGFGAEAQVVAFEQNRPDAPETPDAFQTVPVSAVLKTDRIPLRISVQGSRIDVPRLRSLLNDRYPEHFAVLDELYGTDALRSLLHLPFQIPLLMPGASPPPLILSEPPASESEDSETDSENAPATPAMTSFQTGQQWNRTHTVSLGILGQASLECRYTVTEVDRQTRSVTVRISPVNQTILLPETSGPTVDASRLNVRADLLTGTGTLRMAAHAPHPESMTFEMQFRVAVDGPLTAGGTTRDVHFSQLLTWRSFVSQFEQHRRPQGIPLRPSRPIQ